MMYPLIIALAVIIVTLVIVTVKIAASNRQKSQHLKDLQARLSRTEAEAKASDALLEEVRKQLSRREEEYVKLKTLLDEERASKIKAETEAGQIKIQLNDERELLKKAEEKFKDTFKSLAGETLSNSTGDFLKLAKASLSSLLSEAKGEMSKKEESVKNLVEPLSKSLEKFNREIKDIESNRLESYSKLTEQIKALSQAELALQKETGNLINALRTPRNIGTWGQVTLKRVVELAGLTEHIEFKEEVSTNTEDGRLRPDMIVHLPNDRDIVIDAKATFDSYYEAINAETEDIRNEALKNHARKIRNHIKGLASRAYWNEFSKTPEFVVMFIPGESFFSAAIEYNQKLLEEAMEKRVIIATPTTLVALMRAIAYGWSQKRITQNAIKISSLGKQIYERMSTLSGHIAKIGKGLKSASNAYNSTVGSLESSLLPSARRFKELGVSSSKELSEAEMNDVELRNIANKELNPPAE